MAGSWVGSLPLIKCCCICAARIRALAIQYYLHTRRLSQDPHAWYGYSTAQAPATDDAWLVMSCLDLTHLLQLLCPVVSLCSKKFTLKLVQPSTTGMSGQMAEPNAINLNCLTETSGKNERTKRSPCQTCACQQTKK